MTARNTSSTAIEVSWGEVPANKTGGGILGYDVTYIKQSGRGTSIVVVGSLHVTVSKLEKFTIYCVTVAAFTSKGSGNTSKGVYVTTDEEGKVVLACMQAFQRRETSGASLRRSFRVAGTPACRLKLF